MSPVNFAVQAPETDQGTPGFNRRVVLKAAAILAAMGGAGNVNDLIRSGANPAMAQGESVGFDWYEAEQLGAVGAAALDGPVIIETSFPYTAAGAHWSGDAGGWPIVQLQISYDGSNWSEVFTLTASHDEGAQSPGDRHFTGLVCAEGASHIAYAVFDGDGNRVTVPGFALTYIDSSAGPDLAAVGAANTDQGSPPRIITRSEWGANESYRFTESGEWWTLVYRSVRHAIVHHTETSNVENPTQAIRAVQYYHAVTRGWHDIGYNYLVDRFGNIYQGRAGGRNVVGGHAFDFAYGSSGISFVGNHNFAEVTSSALAGMVAIVAWAIRFQDPYSSSDFWGIPNLPTICGHRDVLNTSCPGDLAYDDLAQIRNLVSQTLAISPSGPVAGLVVGDYVVTNSDVNLRTSAGLTGSVIRLLSEGVHGVVHAGPVTANGSSWYQIATDYATGWSVADFLTRNPPTDWKRGRFGRDQVVELNDSANLRRLPSINGLLIDLLPAGMSATILGGPEDADANRWYKASTLLGQGWIAARFLSPSDQSAPPPASSRFETGDRVIVDDGPVNIRTSSNTSSSIIASLSTGTTGTVLSGPSSGSGYTWYQLSTGSGSGWVADAFLAAAPASGAGKFEIGDSVYVSDGPLNLRSSAGTDATIVAQLSTGDTGTVTNGPSTASGYTWYRIQTAAGSGWAAQDFLSPGSDTPSPSGGEFNMNDDTVVADGPLNMRASASTSASIIAQLTDGARCVIKGGPVTAGGYTWYQVSSGGQIGWVAGEFLAHGPRVGGTVQVYTAGDGSLNLRSSASTSSSIVTSVSEGTTGTVLNGPESSGGYTWWRIQSPAGTGWAAGAFLIPD
ncbi:hypothetical protein BH23CHL4_BH23CHL4_09230 [soil metagenome]